MPTAKKTSSARANAETVTFKFTDADQRRLETLAARYGLTKTAIIRAALLTAERISNAQLILLDGREWEPVFFTLDSARAK